MRPKKLFCTPYERYLKKRDGYSSPKRQNLGAAVAGEGAEISLSSSSFCGDGERTISLSSRSRLISKSTAASISVIRIVSGDPSTLPSLLFARDRILALALLSPNVIFVRSRRAAVAAAPGMAAAMGAVAARLAAALGVAAVGVAAAVRASAAGMAAAVGAAATGMAAIVVTDSGKCTTQAAAAVGITAARAAESALPAAGDEGSSTACAAAANLKAALLFSFLTSCLFLSFSLLFSLGGRFLTRLGAVGATEE